MTTKSKKRVEQALEGLPFNARFSSDTATVKAGLHAMGMPKATTPEEEKAHDAWARLFAGLPCIVLDPSDDAPAESGTKRKRAKRA